jgi:hypothetical protein
MTTTRLARGSLPWPVELAGRPVCRGSLTVEAPIDAGTRLRITAWSRSASDGTRWLSIELEPYPHGGRKPTAHNPPSQRPPIGGAAKEKLT